MIICADIFICLLCRLGKRWKRGDVVGVLLDTDLLEMRYYLNGEDLGPSFADFSITASGLFPAISLNVRQSVRVNFGQHKFTYPPDEVDGKIYKPVRLAFDVPSASETLASGIDDAASVDSDIKRHSPMALDEEFPQAAFDSNLHGGSLNSLVRLSYFSNRHLIYLTQMN